MPHVFAAVQVASVHSWLQVSPHTPHTPSLQLWPFASPTVVPHLLHVFGVVQVASVHSWSQTTSPFL